jgi:hypothetical protein
MNPEKLRNAAADQVDHDHAADGQRQVEQPHPEQVVHAHQPREHRAQARQQVRERPGPVQHPDVRRHPVGDLLTRVRVDAEVPRQEPVGAVQGEDREGDQADDPGERVHASRPALGWSVGGDAIPPGR